ncbi:short chain dehydrogenase domain-containing protein [Sarocladium implicatum]|nr:short chain dehydrogenase domain-containing protein [Sarocladium implicatum]
MPLPRYEYTGPIDHTIPVDTSKLKGKSVIITGGANGMGEACVRAFIAAGAYVTIGDFDDRGFQVAKELNEASGKEVCSFIKVDIRDWDQQKRMFEMAKTRSPEKSVDVVIANAGISRSSGDSMWKLDDPNGEPEKPNLNIVRVNMDGSLYTFKLATHYFRKQPDTPDRDRCFIITGSLNAWIDSPANWEYTATKYALRGFMRTARRNSWEQGIRITYVAPCYIRSTIRSAEYEKWLEDRGVDFGEQEDVAKCMMRIATDPATNGHSLMITPRSLSESGYMDVDREDYRDVPEDAWFNKLQATQLRNIKDEWRDEYVMPIYKH